MRSTDRTSDILSQLSEDHDNLRVVTHERNKGYGSALKTGIRRASHDLIVITDADGTYPQERIPELVSACQNVDMVVGSRTADDVVYPLIRKIPKVFLRKYASWIAGQNIPDINSGLRVFKKSVANQFLNILPNGFSFTTTITLALLTNNYSVKYIPIGYSERVGKSKIKPIRDTLNFIQLIVRTGIYFAPLRIFGPIILALFIIASASVIYDVAIINNLTDKSVILIMFTLNTTMFALLADMIDKRS